MKFYSELTQRLYNTEKELNEAETKIKNAEAEKVAAEKAKKEAKAVKAKAVERALKEANEAQSKAIKLLKEFINEYGYFHTSYSTEDMKKENIPDTKNFFELLDLFLQ